MNILIEHFLRHRANNQPNHHRANHRQQGTPNGSSKRSLGLYADEEAYSEDDKGHCGGESFCHKSGSRDACVAVCSWEATQASHLLSKPATHPIEKTSAVELFDHALLKPHGKFFDRAA